ncbi:MAG: carboxypeptidase regulatory-like domain-containing protein, partial [Faecalimonas sp.]
MKSIHTMQADTPDKGKLKIQINSEITSFPIADASISISYTGVPEQTLEQVTTDSSGQTETLELAAPP